MVVGSRGWDPAPARSLGVAPTLTGVGERLADGGPETSLSTHIDDVIGCLPQSPSRSDARRVQLRRPRRGRRSRSRTGAGGDAGVSRRLCPGVRPVHVRPDACVHAGWPGSGCPVQRSRVADAADSVGATRPARRGRCWSGPVARTRAPGSARPASDRNVPRAGRPPEPAR